jgi:monoamine oxidase
MLETAIIGSGVCGLALARELSARGAGFAVFEARGRLGGRVLTRVAQCHGGPADLGPTWFWPDTQPRMAALIDALGLAHFPQHDEGVALALNDPEKKSVEGGVENLHAGARRLQGGMEALPSALAQHVPSEALHLNHALVSVCDQGDHLVLGFAFAGGLREVRAKRVALCVPPRLLLEQVRFEPALAPKLVDAMDGTPTWMARQAKVVVSYERAVWRDAGYSGSAFVTHERAVLGETFDACGPKAMQPALAGFLALSPATRREFATGLPLLIHNQLQQLFGEVPGHGAQHYQDWATERYTASAADTTREDDHPDACHPLLRQIHWAGSLFFGSAESAGYAAGYLEGALEAASRLARDLAFVSALTAPARWSQTPSPEGKAKNATSIAAFQAWAKALPSAAFERYRLRLTRALGEQAAEQVTQRALLGAVEESYRDALAQLEALPFDPRGVPVEHGRSALTPLVQAAFSEFLPRVFDEVVRFNRSSCALSNFADEHDLPAVYLGAIRSDVTAAFREFCQSANALLVAKVA